MMERTDSSTTRHLDDIYRALDAIADHAEEIGVSAGLATMGLALRERIGTFVSAIQHELVELRCGAPGCQALGTVPRGLDGLYCAAHAAERVLCRGCGHDVVVDAAHYERGDYYHRECLPESYADFPFVGAI